MKRRRTWPGESKGGTTKQRQLEQDCADSDRSSVPCYAAVVPSSYDGTEGFTHEPLKDSKNEIRLLQMLPGGNDNDDCLKFSIRTVDFRRVPDFVAISYTWGAETSQQSILIDTKEYTVRQNCHYVMKQAYRQWKRSTVQCDLLWIDSVCINQQDKVEKSFQVAMMGEIYAKARLVLACVGPHTNDSEFFIEKAREVADFEYECNHREPGEFLCQVCVLPWRDWTLSLGIENLSRLCGAYEKFSRRNYWTRVWIIQEIAKATTLQILCGNEMLAWTAIDNLEDFITIEMDEIDNLFDTYETLPSPDFAQMHDVFVAKKRSVPVDEVFSQFYMSSCGDPRDHLYGLLSLISWPQDAGPIFPDYNTSVFYVAVQMELYLPFQQIPEMLAIFQIKSKDDDVQRLIRQRREQKDSEDPNSAAYAVREFKAMHADKETKEGGPVLCSRVQLDENGDMTATLVKWVSKGHLMPLSPSESLNSSENLSEEFSGSEEGEDFELIASSLLSTPPEWKPRAVMLGSEIAGFVCHDTREGDVLVPLIPGKYEVCLVLRPNHGESYDIVGQGVFRPGYRFGCEPGVYDDLTEVPLFRAQVELKITAEDAILLFAQDTCNLDVDPLPTGDSDPDHSDCRCNQVDHWERVLTGVSGMLCGAARITMQTQMLAKDVAMVMEPFDPMEAFSMIEKVRGASSSIPGQNSTWVVGRIPPVESQSQKPPAGRAADMP